MVYEDNKELGSSVDDLLQEDSPKRPTKSVQAIISSLKKKNDGEAETNITNISSVLASLWAVAAGKHCIHAT